MEQFATAIQGFVSLVARLSIAAIFLVGAIATKIPQFQQTAEYMASKGIPNPRFALFGAIGLLLLGGVSVVAGAWTRFGAIFLFVFLAAATFYFHDFWQIADAAQREAQWAQFLKNLAIGGGLLSLIAFGGGPWSVDGWIEMKQAEAESAPATKTRSPVRSQQAA